MLTMSECTRNNFCFECDNEKCVLHGKKESDCPIWWCGRPDDNCEHCAFIDRLISDWKKNMRGSEQEWQ